MELLKITKFVDPPKKIETEILFESFDSIDGWEVVFAYQKGVLKGVDHFISPVGEIITKENKK